MSETEEHQTRALLAPFHDCIADAATRGWADWFRHTRCPHPIDDRARACLVWSYMTTRAEWALHSDPRVTIVARQQTKWFIIDHRMLFRFKKGNQQGLSSNVATTQALAFHEPQGSLPGIPDLTRVDVVYVLNQLGTDIQSLHIVRRAGPEVAWSYELDRVRATNVVPLSADHHAPPPATARAVVQPKPSHHHLRGTQGDDTGDGE